MSKRVTLREIAQRCGVSRAAVSRILSGHKDRFSAETRRRVEAAAAEMGYAPDLVGRTLIGGRSMCVGCLTIGQGSRVGNARLQAMMAVAQERGYDMLVRITGRGVNDTQRLIAHTQRLLARRVDGLILVRSTPLAAEARRFLKTLTVPTVFVDRGPPGEQSRIVLQRQPGFNALAQHLADLGHRRAVLFASVGSADFPEARSYAYKRAFARAGVELAVTYEQRPIDGNPADAYRAARAARRGYEAVRGYLAAHNPRAATALCMNNDDAAIGALAALREAGVRVPEDISVAGVDDLEAAAFCHPPLTTVRAPREEVGEAAFGMLERLMCNPDAKVKPETFAYRLVPRQSTGAAPDTRAAHRTVTRPAPD